MDLKSRVPKGLKEVARPLAWRLSDIEIEVRGKFMPPRRLVSPGPRGLRISGPRVPRLLPDPRGF